MENTFICNEQKVCVLAVDDDPNFLQVLENTAETIPFYEIVGVTSVEDARIVFQPGEFAIGIIDLVLEETTLESIELVKHIRQLDKDIILVVCTGYATRLVENDRDLMISVDYLIEKPFTYRFLRSRLFSWGFHYRDRKECNERFATLTCSMMERLDKLDHLSNQINQLIIGDG